MNWDEYNKLFHKLELNLVAFKPLMECDKEVLKLVNAAIEEEREACAKICDAECNPTPNEGNITTYQSGCYITAEYLAAAIRARGQSENS
jgi:hypothetical protein